MSKKIKTLSAPEAREYAIQIASEIKLTHKELIPCRVDKNTIILVRSKDQASKFMAKLETSRNNY